MICLKCQEETLNPKFCSKSCAAKYNNKNRIRTKESKEKLSIKMKQLNLEGKAFSPSQLGITNRGARWAKKPDSNWIEYKKSCIFYTPYYIFKKIEGHELVNIIGWFHPKRNVQGASRDHLYSVYDGWKNKIPVSIISHPANCKIISIKENKVKAKKSSITLEELYIRIEKWRE